MGYPQWLYPNLRLPIASGSKVRRAERALQCALTFSFYSPHGCP